MWSTSSSAPSWPPTLEALEQKLRTIEAIIPILHNTTSQDSRIRADAEEKLQSIDAGALCAFLAVLTVKFHAKKESSSRLLALSHLEKAAHRFECTEFFQSIIEKFLRNENEAARQWPLLCRDLLVSSAVDLEATALYFCQRFLPFILKSFDSSSEATHQELALLLLHKFVQFDHITGLVLDSMADRLCEKLKLFFLGAEEVSLKVRIAAVQASFGCILHLLNNENEGVFQLLLAQVMNTVFSDGELAFENGEQEYALAVLFRLIDVARRKPEFLQDQAEILIQFALKYVESEYSNDRFGIELVVLLAERSRIYHQKVLPVLIKALNDFPNPEIQLPAARAVGYFIQTSPSDILALHIGEIVTPILGCIEKGDANLKMAAMGALTLVASSSSKDQFQPHYRNVLHQLEATLRGAAAADESDHLLVAARIECISTVCLAVGKETCGGDILMVVKWLVSVLVSDPVLEDPIRIQVLQAWGRLCKCLGLGFQPYLELAMPPLLQSSKFDPYVFSNDDDCQTEQSDKSIKVIEPMVLEHMSTACKVLCTCVAEIREGLGSWTDKVAEALIPILKFENIKDVAFVAVLALLVILQSSYKVALDKNGLPQCQESPFQEASLSKIRAKILDSLDEYLKLCDMNSSIFSRPYIDELVNVILEVHVVSKDKTDEEQEVYEKAGKCLVTFIKASTQSLAQFFDKLLSYIPQLLDKTDEERRIALHIFCGLAEQCQGKAVWYCKTNLPILFRASGNESPEVQQLVAKAIGISAEFGGSAFEHVLGDALSSLNTIMGDPRALPQDYLPAHDAAVSALEKIFLFQREKLIEAEKVVDSWLDHLPIRGDLDGARVVHDQLLSVFKKLDVRTCFPHIDRIISIFSEVMHLDDPAPDSSS